LAFNKNSIISLGSSHAASFRKQIASLPISYKGREALPTIAMRFLDNHTRSFHPNLALIENLSMTYHVYHFESSQDEQALYLLQKFPKPF